MYLNSKKLLTMFLVASLSIIAALLIAELITTLIPTGIGIALSFLPCLFCGGLLGFFSKKAINSEFELNTDSINKQIELQNQMDLNLTQLLDLNKINSEVLTTPVNSSNSTSKVVELLKIEKYTPKSNDSIENIYAGAQTAFWRNQSTIAKKLDLVVNGKSTSSVLTENPSNTLPLEINL